MAEGELSCQLYQRSADVGLGVPFNIASYALLTRMLAQVGAGAGAGACGRPRAGASSGGGGGRPPAACGRAGGPAGRRQRAAAAAKQRPPPPPRPARPRQVCGLRPGDFVHTLGDAHVYSNHVEPLQQQLRNAPRPFPALALNPEVRDIDAFAASDFSLAGYAPHSAIKMAMAV